MTVHYVYKITDPKTDQFYIGSRTCEGNPENDNYMGSYKTWNPEDENRLEKEIIKCDFETREDAIEYEAKVIEENIDNELNENYYIPNKGFHVAGLHKGKNNPATRKEVRKKMSIAQKKRLKNPENHPMYGKTHTDEVKELLRKQFSGKNNPYYGKKHSKEVRKKMSENHADVSGGNNPRARAVMYIENGNVYETVTDASKYFDYARTTISAHCNNRVKNPKFRYYNGII